MSPLSSQFDPRMPTCLTIVLSRGTRLPRGIAIQDERRAPARHRMRISSHSNEACFDVVFRALAEVGPTRLALADNPYTWEPPGAWVVLFAAQSRSEVGRNLPGGKNLNVVMWTYVGGLGFIKDHPGVRCDRGPHVPSTINPPAPGAEQIHEKGKQHPPNPVSHQSLEIPITPISSLTDLPFLFRPTDRRLVLQSQLKPQTFDSFLYSSRYAPNHDTPSSPTV